MQTKQVNILEVGVKYKDIPVSMDYYEFDRHCHMGAPTLFQKSLHKRDKTFDAERIPVKEILDVRDGQEKHINYIATPEVQDIIDAEVNTNTYEIKHECAVRERTAEKCIARAEQESSFARNEIYNLRQRHLERETRWAKESFIGHVVCFLLGCAVTACMILGG